MMFTFERISNPDVEPVTLAEAKRHLKEFDGVTSRDDDIEGLIVNAREWVEDFTGRALIDQEWRLTISASDRRDGDLTVWKPKSGYVCGDYQWRRVGEIMLRKSPAMVITRFVTVDDDGVETTVDSDTYALREAGTKWPRVVALTGATWPSAAEIRIEFRAGYLEETSITQDMIDAVPQRFKQAIRLHVEAHYDRDPEMMSKLLKVAEDLIRPERVEHGFA